MKISHLDPLAVLFIVLSLGTAGCGTTGGTSTFVLHLTQPGAAPLAKQLSVASVIMEENAPALVTAGVFDWGRFDTNDLAHIAQSLGDTVALLPSPRGEPKRLQLHVVVRKYAVAVSNTSGAVLACIAWAVTESGGELIHEEEFYCAKKVYLVGTLGLLKDAANKAMVRRIAERSALLATQKPAVDVREVLVRGTYDSVEEAAAHLPKRVVSLGHPGITAVGGPVGLVGLALPSAASEVGWNSFQPASEFDWTQYLAGQSKP